MAFRWPTDPPGKKPSHSISWQEHQQHRASAGLTGPRKGVPRPTTLPPPPPGTYDPALDYQAGAANRGYGYQQNDAQTAFETGTEDYNQSLAGLLRSHDRNQADLTQQRAYENQDFQVATGNLGRQYSILGHQQSDAAAQHGITSGGLLALSAQKRAANQAHDQAALNLAHVRQLNAIHTAGVRDNEDYTTQKTALDAGYARQFGGFNGTVLNDPYTGKPMVGSLATSLSRAGTENTFYQQGLLGQEAYQAQQGGYIDPGVLTNATGGFSPAQAARFNRRRRKAAA